MRTLKLLLALTVLFAAGCGGSGADPDPAGEVPPSFLRVELGDRNVKLDPGTVWDAWAINVFGALFDPLYRYDRAGHVLPNLAAGPPVFTSDGTVARIPLRRDARFHDDPCFPGGKGRLVRAEDVVYSLKRIARPDNVDGPWPLLQGRFVGLDAFRAALGAPGGSFDAPVAGLRAVSEGELELTLTRPFSQLLDVLAMPSLGVVPREAVERYGADFAVHPVGSGPYRLRSYAAEVITLAAVPGHWRFESAPSAAGTTGPTPAPGLAFRHFDDPWEAFRAGELDEMEITSRYWFAYVDEDLAIKKDLLDAGYQLTRVQQPWVRSLVFNHAQPELRDVHLRRALRLAIPWRQLVEPQEICSASLVPRGLAGYLPLDHAQDLAAARRELEAAGHPGGAGLPTFLIRYRYFDRELRDAAVVQDALTELGLTCRLVHRTDRSMDGLHLGFLGWALDYPDAANVFSLFLSSAVPPDGWNHGRYQNPDYDALVASARPADYQAVTRFVDDQVVAVPFRQMDQLFAQGPRVAAFAADPMGYALWADVRVK